MRDYKSKTEVYYIYNTLHYCWGELMKFDRNMPLKARIAKRRRQKRAKFFTVVLLLSLVMAAGLFDGISVESVVDGLNSFLSGSQNAARQVLSEDRGDVEDRNDIEGRNGTDDGHSTDNASADDTSPDNIRGDLNQSGNLTENNKPDGLKNVEQTDNTKTNGDIKILKKDLESYIKKFNGQYGIYYINLADGSEFGINDTSEYIAASTVKIPINLYLYKKIEDGSVNRNGTMTYLQSDYEGGTGKIQYEEVGSKYTVKELSRLSIEVSDNVATNILLRLLGRKNVKDYMRKLGGTVVEDDRNVSSPRDMALYMKKVYEFYKDNSLLGKELMGYFENTVFNERIPRLLPGEVKVAHKIGNQVEAFHDVGIVFASKPYIISIMSKGVSDETEAYNVIANISKKVYDFVTEKK